jgi:hypothetical protein
MGGVVVTLAPVPATKKQQARQQQKEGQQRTASRSNHSGAMTSKPIIACHHSRNHAGREAWRAVARKWESGKRRGGVTELASANDPTMLLTQI